MKYTTAILLLGAVSAQNESQVWSLRSVQDHRTDSGIQQAYFDHSVKQANARPPYQSSAQIESDSDSSSEDQNVYLGDEEDHSGEFFPAGQHEQEGAGAYNRVTPTRFSADSDDIFMRSMIQNYALEGKNKDGSPNGQFWIDEAGARAAAKEVLKTNAKMNSAAIPGYLNTYFGKAWGHFDVNRTGKIEVIKMPQFMRFLASDQSMYLW